MFPHSLLSPVTQLARFLFHMLENIHYTVTAHLAYERRCCFPELKKRHKLSVVCGLDYLHFVS